MTIRFFEGLDAIPAGFGPSAVAVGKFDGIHLGHQNLIARLRAGADAAGLIATVVTFDRNPLSLLRPEDCPPNVVSNRQKIELLADSGIDAVIMLEFTHDLMELPAEQFIQRILIDALDARLVLAGSDFKFGAHGDGDLATLRAFGQRRGFDVEVADEVLSSGAGAVPSTRRASSSWVREALAHGDVRTAADLLGRPHAIRSTVVHGEQRGRELGYPTANLDPAIEGLLPADGVYAAWATVDGVRYGAAVSIGNNPTFEGIPQHQVEAHLLDQKLDLYDRSIEVAFVEHIRPMRAFESTDALVTQLRADEQEIRRILSAEGWSGQAAPAVPGTPPRP